MRKCRALLFALSIFPMYVCAEGRCPDGYFPIGGGNAGWEGCVPMGPEAAQPMNQQAPKWETRWGAIATANGAFGVANDKLSEQQAIDEALFKCRAESAGAVCKLKSSYYDQCAALAWGDGVNIVFSSPDITDAENSAVHACSGYTTNCRVFYSGCSYAERIN